jgi:hypothetical protein
MIRFKKKVCFRRKCAHGSILRLFVGLLSSMSVEVAVEALEAVEAAAVFVGRRLGTLATRITGAGEGSVEPK